MKRYLTVGIISSILIVIVVAFSWFTFPAWQNPASGGFWALLGATIVGVMIFVQSLVSIWKDLKDEGKEEQKPPVPVPIQSIDSQKADSIYNAPSGTINIYRQEHGQIPIPHPLQLPPTAPDFVGREDEIEFLLKGIIDGGGAAISGLTGMGGIGKTALGLEIAHRLKEHYPEGWLFIDLKGTSIEPLLPTDVMKFIINSFDLNANFDDLDTYELTGLYQSTLTGKKALLFLDNVYDGSQIASLMPPSTCLTLITSRLHFVIPGLHSLQLDVLKEKDAISLLLTICQRIGEDAQIIAELCGYLPIALRLAGGFLQVHSHWSPKEYASELSDRAKRMSFLKLEGSAMDIEMTFELSYQQLLEDEQSKWKMLAVFPSSFKSNAAKAIWDADEDTAHSLLGKFLQHSLIEYYPSSGRFRLHDLLLDFAASKFKLDKQRDEVLVRYIQYYWEIWENSEDLYGKGNEEAPNALKVFDSERMNIENALNLALNYFHRNNHIPRIIKQIPNTIYVFRLRIHPSQQLKWLNASLTASQKLGDRSNENRLLGNIGVAFSRLGDQRHGIEYTQKALTIAREIGDRQREGFWLGNLAHMYSILGQQHHVIEYTEQALSIARETGDRQREGFWLGNLSADYYDLGEFKRGLEYVEQALAIAKDMGDRERESVWLGNTGFLYYKLGESQRAVEYIEQSLSIARELGSKNEEALRLAYLAEAYSDFGDKKSATEYAMQSLVIAQETGDRRLENRVLGTLGVIYSNLEDQDRAIDYTKQALTLAQELGDQRNEGAWLGNLGEILSYIGEYDTAITYVEQALSIALELKDKGLECQILEKQGVVFSKLREFDRALGSLNLGLIKAKEIGYQKIQAECLYEIASVYKTQKNDSLALRYAREAELIFKAIKFAKADKVKIFINELTI